MTEPNTQSWEERWNEYKKKHNFMVICNEDRKSTDYILEFLATELTKAREEGYELAVRRAIGIAKEYGSSDDLIIVEKLLTIISE